MYKKIIATILALAMMLSLVSCSSNSSSTVATTDANTETGDAVKKPDNWPKKTITIIVPHASGGATDLLARALASDMSEILGVSVIVDCKAGGGGAVGMAQAAAAAADGYTLAMGAMGAHSIAPMTLGAAYSYEDFAQICTLTETPFAISVNKDSKFNTLEEMLAYAKDHPGELTYGTAGAGSAYHVWFASFLLKHFGDANLMTHVAYGGGAEAVTSLLGGHVDCAVSSSAEHAPYITSGDFKGLAITSEKRVEELPDTPSIGEAGYPDDAAGTWFAISAPAKTDAAIVSYLETVIMGIMKTDKMIEICKNLNQPIVLRDGKTFYELWKNAWENNKATLQALGLYK